MNIFNFLKPIALHSGQQGIKRTNLYLEQNGSKEEDMVINLDEDHIIWALLHFLLNTPSLTFSYGLF